MQQVEASQPCREEASVFDLTPLRGGDSSPGGLFSQISTQRKREIQGHEGEWHRKRIGKAVRTATSTSLFHQAEASSQLWEISHQPPANPFSVWSLSWWNTTQMSPEAFLPPSPSFSSSSSSLFYFPKCNVKYEVGEKLIQNFVYQNCVRDFSPKNFTMWHHVNANISGCPLVLKGHQEWCSSTVLPSWHASRFLFSVWSQWWSVTSAESTKDEALTVS